MSHEPSDVTIVADLADDGTLRPHTAELVTAGRRIADALGGSLRAVALAPGRASATNVASLAGVDNVVWRASTQAIPYTADVWASGIDALIDATRDRVVLLPGSLAGRDYAPRIAARRGLPLVAEVTGIDLDEANLIVRRNLLGGRVETAIGFSAESIPAMMTVRPGAFTAAPRGDRIAPVEELGDSALRARVNVVESTVHLPKGAALTTAKRIVSGGRGLGGPDAFAMIEELAGLLDAAVSASGAVVGAGWRSHDDQVGSTGHTVSPALYLAVGISGAPQHLVGMQGADYVVAINRDPAAPIFDIASFGIVGDLFTVVPALIAELKARRT